MSNDLADLRYPIGRYQINENNIDELQINTWISEIEQLPRRLKNEVSGLTDVQLDTPYRTDGWTLRQVIHHLPDSHMNAYIRFKLAFTEDSPTIRPYYEDRWADCEEAKYAPVQASFDLLDSLHTRWILFLKTMKQEDFNRAFHHPEHNKNFKLKEIVGMYAWHGNHHLAHITETKNRNNW